jgi:hypothetical protein
MVFTTISKLVGIIIILCGLFFVITAIGFPITEWIPRFALPKGDNYRHPSGGSGQAAVWYSPRVRRRAGP